MTNNTLISLFEGTEYNLVLNRGGNQIRIISMETGFAVEVWTDTTVERYEELTNSKVRRFLLEWSELTDEEKSRAVWQIRWCGHTTYGTRENAELMAGEYSDMLYLAKIIMENLHKDHNYMKQIKHFAVYELNEDN